MKVNALTHMFPAQVDHPYMICKIKEQVNDQLKRLLEPHWKGGISRVESSMSKQKFLSKLHDFVGDRIRTALGIATQQERCPNQHIKDYIAKYIKLEKMNSDAIGTLNGLRQEMKEAAKTYDREFRRIAQKAEQLYKDNEEEQKEYRRTWTGCYLDKVRKALFPSSHSDPDNLLRAAVLYEQTHIVAQEKAQQCETSIGQFAKIGSKDFAWQVGTEYLCMIVARGENKGSLPTVMSKEAEKLMFGKTKK
jgi:hypothetical protein